MAVAVPLRHAMATALLPGVGGGRGGADADAGCIVSAAFTACATAPVPPLRVCFVEDEREMARRAYCLVPESKPPPLA